MYDGPLSGAALTQRVQTMLVGPAAGSAELPPLEVDQGDTGDGRSHFHPLATCTVRRAGTSKATALAWLLAERLPAGAGTHARHPPALTSADCCAFGDGDNDVKMLQWAGWAVAPANAVERAQAAAKVVSGRSNDEDFIAHALVQLLLEDDAEASGSSSDSSSSL